MKIQIMDKTKKRKFVKEISYLGVEKIGQMLLKTGTERVRAFSGSLSNEELMALWRLFPIEGVGLYFGKDMMDKKTGRRDVRISLDALHVLKEQISGNVIELDGEAEEKWFRGEDLDGDFDGTSKPEQSSGNITGFVAVKSKESEDFIGTGKITNDKKRLISFLPKERRRRN